MDKLLVSVLGHRNSGKSFTWNTLFDATVRTGTTERRLYFNDVEYVIVFLVSGSPEEREKYVGEIITINNPSIVFCSVQYAEGAKDTFNYFIENEYRIYCQWLNPGHDDENSVYFDYLGLGSWILARQSLLGIRSGKDNAEPRVQEIKDFVYGWAKSKNLIQKDKRLIT